MLAPATATCRAVRTLTAEIAVSGSAGGHRLRGRLSAGVAAPASVRLEAVAPFGPPLFIFVAMGDDAALLLPVMEIVWQHGKSTIAKRGGIAGASEQDDRQYEDSREAVRSSLLLPCDYRQVTDLGQLGYESGDRVSVRFPKSCTVPARSPSARCH